MDDAANALKLIKQRVGQNARPACQAADWAVIKGGQPITFLRFHALEVIDDDSADAAREG